MGRKILFITTDHLWGDPGFAKLRSDLVADLYDHLPPPRQPQLRVEAPA